MNELQNFNFNGNQLRTVLIDNEPFFVGKDAAAAIGYSNTRKAIRDHVKGKYLREERIVTPSGVQTVTVISEPGLYQLAGESKLPSAEPFQDWVYEEVLPTIRKHGAYMTNEVIERTLTSPDFIIQLATKLKDEQEARLELEKENSQLSLDLAEANKKLPFLEWALQTKGLVTPTIIAKKYGKTAVWLNDWLHKQGVQFKQGKCWVLYKKYDDKGYSDTIFSPTDIDHLHPSMKWTVKGMKFIYELLKENGYLPISEQDDLAS
ncbi:phage antirepressor protein [Lactococcus lactis subsp. lactis]|uniref:phage antirepressor n=1 Tax=Lactococcus lactis TaxID=1358 RepID=UPI00223B8331|nr:phage antirepressor [Lactococcus lactis]MCT0061964.1 phage antirepressor protein [Lactococcus lactis subsp. lactis]MCT0138401.1 phage antirepressor protein [Lactococcus lactis subsp. lactis]